MADRFRIRPATVGDLPAIAMAEPICFSDPWSATALRELFQTGTSTAIVASDDPPANRLAGYLFARAIGDEAEILNVAVLPEFRRLGVGRQLIAVALDRLVGHGIRKVFLEVRESNDPARGLYAGLGFRPVGMRPDYYRKPREHALVLAWAPA
ncbi:MAG: ribosomal protein S18-alanine N-acetyltransferase [Gemmatimonadota bacterium]